MEHGAHLFNIENLVLRARSEFNGFAGKDCELFWSTRVLEFMKSQIPKTEVSGFSVQVSVFCFSSLTPDTRHLAP